MTIPRWLQAHLENTGRWNPDGIARTATTRRCPRCSATTLQGLDADRCAGTATTDPTPLTPLGEALALLAGRRTYQLTTTGRLRLDDRGPLNITGHPADTVHVVAEHACGTDPLPRRPDPPTPTTRTLPADAPAPF